MSETITSQTQEQQQTQIVRKNVLIKNCAQFTESISEISNTQTDNAKVIDIVTLMYDLIELSDNY